MDASRKSQAALSFACSHAKHMAECAQNPRSMRPGVTGRISLVLGAYCLVRVSAKAGEYLGGAEAAAG